MKTLSLLASMLFCLSLGAFARDEMHERDLRDQRFMLAGTVLKSEAEFKLTAKAESAAVYFKTMVSRRGITIGKPSFVELENRVNDFLDTKESYNERLHLYGFYTTTQIDSDLVRIVRVYFQRGRLTYQDDEHETIRRKIAEKTGYDVTIGNGFARTTEATFAYIVFSVLIVLIFSLSGRWIKYDFDRAMVRFAVPVCILFIFWTLYFFVW